MIEGPPDELALADPAAKPTRKGESFLPKSIRDGGGGVQFTESLKEFTEARLDPRIGVKHDGAGGVVAQAHRQGHFKRAAPRFAALAADETGFE
jgi:hypothetical protein